MELLKKTAITKSRHAWNGQVDIKYCTKSCVPHSVTSAYFEEILVSFESSFSVAHFLATREQKELPRTDAIAGLPWDVRTTRWLANRHRRRGALLPLVDAFAPSHVAVPPLSTHCLEYHLLHGLHDFENIVWFASCYAHILLFSWHISSLILKIFYRLLRMTSHVHAHCLSYMVRYAPPQVLSCVMVLCVISEGQHKKSSFTCIIKPL